MIFVIQRGCHKPCICRSTIEVEMNRLHCFKMYLNQKTVGKIYGEQIKTGKRFGWVSVAGI